VTEQHTQAETRGSSNAGTSAATAAAVAGGEREGAPQVNWPQALAWRRRSLRSGVPTTVGQEQLSSRPREVEVIDMTLSDSDGEDT
jgi:hypothetical protein